MKRDAGFSLIETLFAVFVLGAGLVGLLEAITLSLKSSKDSWHHSNAVLLAASRLELLRAEAYVVPGSTEGEFGEEFPLYSWSGNITAEFSIPAATACWLNLEVSSMRFNAPWSFNAAWRDETPTFKTTSGLIFASAFILAT